MQRFSQKSEGFEPLHWAPQPRVLRQEDKSPEPLALKARGAYFWESQRAIGNKLHS